MIRPHIATLTILALVLLAVCCQILPSVHMHDMMQTAPGPLAHLALLAMSTPASVWALLFFIVAGLLWFAAVIPSQTRETVRVPHYVVRPPDNLFASPLRIALSEGILNPKPF